ncbi:MAG: VpsF family polysaccharide biosynthesis protein [Rhizobiales bacterium]|nr:VpsF family polysaccharide biosynthesis protein [Hyphomicrobiales bacterium]
MISHANGQPRLYDGSIGFIAVLIVALMLSVSPMALNALGWNYDGLGGAGPTRFHPASYLTVLLFIFIALRDGNPLASAISALGYDFRLALFAIVWVVVFYHGVKNQELPAAGLIDTFLMPMLMLMIFRRLGDITRTRIEAAMHALLAINAVLGLAEFLTGLRLTPYIAGGILITDDWRSTALLGHPLGNALMTGCYIMMLLMGGGTLLHGRTRYAILGLQFSAQVAFGGRASIVLLILFAGVILMIGLFRFLAGARIPLKNIAIIGVLLPVLILGLGGLYELGFFDKFIMRFVEDKGSANARIVMFELFRGFTWTELLLGPPQVNLNYYVHVHKLEFGIESVWIAFSLYYGILPAILFFTGLLFFLFAVMARCQKRGWLVIGYFFLVNTTFLGIAGKSINFTNLIMMLLVLLPAIRLPQRVPNQDRATGEFGAPRFASTVPGQFNRGWR